MDNHAEPQVDQVPLVRQITVPEHFGMNTPVKALGASIRDLRRQSDSARSRFAKLVGVGTLQLSLYEHGAVVPQPKTIVRLCSVVGADPRPVLRLRRDTVASNIR